MADASFQIRDLSQLKCRQGKNPYCYRQYICSVLFLVAKYTEAHYKLLLSPEGWCNIAVSLQG